MAILDLILGPMVVGAFVSVFLGGILVTQCYSYFTRFPSDPKWMRGMVWYFLVTDLFHSGLEIAIIYEYTVTLFGDMVSITSADWVFAIVPVTSVCISSPAQAFFAWRVSRLTRVRFLGWIIYLLAFVQFLCGIGVTIAVTIVKNFSQFQKFEGLVLPWLACSAVCDLIITASLVFYLHSNKSGIAATDDIVTKLIRLTVQTGGMTLVWAILDLVVFLTEKNSLHLLFNFPLAKIYTNSLMSTLNARRTQAETVHTSGGTGGRKLETTVTASMPAWDRPSKTPTVAEKKGRTRSIRAGMPIEIAVRTEEYTHSAVTHDIPIGRGGRNNTDMTAFDPDMTMDIELDQKHKGLASELDMA